MHIFVSLYSSQIKGERGGRGVVYWRKTQFFSREYGDRDGITAANLDGCGEMLS